MFQYLIEAYTNIMVGKSISDLTSNALHSMRRPEPNSNIKEEYSVRARTATSFHKRNK